MGDNRTDSNFTFTDSELGQLNRIARRTHRMDGTASECAITRETVDRELKDVIEAGRCSGDCPFKARARFYQAVFAKLVLGLGLESGEVNSKSRFGNILERESAENYGNFFHGFADVIKKETELLKYNPNLRANTLRSEHIPLNVFVPMGMDTESRAFAGMVFNDVLGSDRISEVTGIQIEKKPKPKGEFLNDNTGFDAYVEYLNHDGGRCGIGIEVKYTEGAYSIGKKESREVTEPDSPYMRVSSASGNYLDGRTETLAGDEARQLWRNHLLGASMVLSDGPEHLEEFTSVHLYPERNLHFSHVGEDGTAEGAIHEYMGTLSPKGLGSFVPVTFEKFFELLSKHYPSEKFGEWINYLCDRYIPSEILSDSRE